MEHMAAPGTGTKGWDSPSGTWQGPRSWTGAFEGKSRIGIDGLLLAYSRPAEEALKVLTEEEGLAGEEVRESSMLVRWIRGRAWLNHREKWRRRGRRLKCFTRERKGRCTLVKEIGGNGGIAWGGRGRTALGADRRGREEEDN